MFVPIPETEIHVWRIGLDVSPRRQEALARTLSREERKRGGRFLLEPLRRRFTVGRGALREILGRCVGEAPGGLRFESRRGGKPELSAPAGWRFSFSHSDDLALLAVCRRHELGVDLEAVRAVKDLAGLGAQFLAPDEAEALCRLPDSLRGSAFFRYWTCKEAVLKATGEGLGGSLRDFSVTFEAARPPRLVWMTGDDPERWEIHSFEPAEGFVAAVAVRERGLRLVHHIWESEDST